MTLAGVATVVVLAYFAIYRGHLWRLSIPIGFLGVFTAVAVWHVGRASIRSFFNSPHFQPAIRLNMNREPKLAAFIRHVCGAVGTKEPDAILLHLGPKFSVMQGRLNVLNAQPRGRILVMSLPLLSVLSVGELRAIIAHEFAHFTGRDTLYSSIAMRVYASAGESAAILFAMWQSGNWFLKLFMALPMLPAAGILYLYTWLFHRLNMYLSRAREFRADSIAATIAGTRFMRSSLRKIVGYSVVMEPLYMSKANESIEQREPRDSPYRLLRKLVPELSADAAQSAEQFIAHEAANAADSHPNVKRRLAALPESSGISVQGLDAHALTLVAELKRYEKLAGDHLVEEYRAFQRDRPDRDPTPHLH